MDLEVVHLQSIVTEAFEKNVELNELSELLKIRSPENESLETKTKLLKIHIISLLSQKLM